jgi:hypothetical protein
VTYQINISHILMLMHALSTTNDQYRQVETIFIWLTIKQCKYASISNYLLHLQALFDIIACVFTVSSNCIDNLHMVVSIIYRLSYNKAWIWSHSLWELKNLKRRLFKYSYMMTHALIAVLLLLWLDRTDSIVKSYINDNIQW